MKLFTKNNKFTIYNDSCLKMLEDIECNSIDSIVTDPPYELGFMGKSWDNTGIAFQKETWQKCYEVLKPGGYLLAFGGSRTFHRIACAIEDAGFEIRDTIMWLYGCLSNDTEILTSKGWKKHDEIQENDEIYSLDLKANKLIKNKCKHVFKYNYDGDMINLKNQNTDQLLTPNHHVIVKDVIRTRAKDKLTNYSRHDYWIYKDAWQIRSERTTLPLASNYDGTIKLNNLFCELLGMIIADGSYHKDTNAVSLYQTEYNKGTLKRIRYILGKLGIKYSEYTREVEYDSKNFKNKLKEDKHGKTYIEHQFYIGEQSVDTVNKIKELCPDKKLNWNLLELSLSNKESLILGLCEGDGGKAPVKFGFEAFYQKDISQLEIFQVLLHMTNKQGWINENHICCSIHLNSTTEIQGKHMHNRIVENYKGGFVWCIETEVGNFMARRNGKVFITGNSGFPKSMNVGLAIDKKNGVESPVVGYNEDILKKQAKDLREGKRIISKAYNAGAPERNNGFLTVSAEVRKAQNEYSGWGTALKPAFEPVIVARKPCEGSTTDNVLKYGVGGINIDECRVPLNGENQPKGSGNSCNSGIDQKWGFVGNEGNITSDLGRFPANVMLTYDDSDYEEVCGGFPDTKGEIGRAGRKSAGNYEASSYKVGITTDWGVKDSGSASRYFYCAKASKRDRDEGLNGFEEYTTGALQGGRKEGSAGSIMQNINGGTRVNPYAGAAVPKKNIHPTVKPTSLMSYLVRLVTPKDGIVLDPFMGSGSTGKATMYENIDRNADYKFIGIELQEEYCEIAEARIKYAIKDNSLIEEVTTEKHKEKTTPTLQVEQLW